MNEKRVRLDVFLAEKGFSASREKAKRDILSGWVRVNGETIRDTSKKIDGSELVEVGRPSGLFVSRGGEKLRHGLDVFKINPSGMTAADLGASTGGFTDCLLKAGALKVYAVDVGYGQLDFSLRRDSRVVVIEHMNVRNLGKEHFADEINFAAMDLSFISVTKVIPHIKELFAAAQGVMLIKPQFEAAPNEHKKGVVRKEEDHTAILKRTLGSLAAEGTIFHGLTYSPIKGPAGNIEFLLHFSFRDSALEQITADEAAAIAESIVKEAHAKLQTNLKDLLTRGSDSL